ncbi:MAG: DUF4956 domain-containing protein [Gemmatimonadales bacterium]
MESRSSSSLASPSTRVLIKVVLYYAVLIPLGWLVLNKLPATSGFAVISLQPILGDGLAGTSKSAAAAVSAHPGGSIAVAAAMLSAMLFSLPVAWIYQLTRAKRGYQQSVVQLLIILPLVVAGVVILVKDSLSLAFSLAGIVAAVRFRNSLDDSKDAVYVFLATGVGLAAAVDIKIAMVISMMFNAAILILWYTDFGDSPVELEGSIAAKRLKRAKALARTGTFVAQIDNEVLKNMTRDQLEGVAQKALRRVHGDGSKEDEAKDKESVLRVRTRDANGTRRGLELILGEYAKDWRTGAVTIDTDGIATLDYFIKLKKSTQPEELTALARTAGGSELIDAELR